MAMMWVIVSPVMNLFCVVIEVLEKFGLSGFCSMIDMLVFASCNRFYFPVL